MDEASWAWPSVDVTAWSPQADPNAIWWGGALAAVLSGTFLLRLGDRIPDPLRQAPSPLA